MKKKHEDHARKITGKINHDILEAGASLSGKNLEKFREEGKDESDEGDWRKREDFLFSVFEEKSEDCQIAEEARRGKAEEVSENLSDQVVDSIVLAAFHARNG